MRRQQGDRGTDKFWNLLRQLHQKLGVRPVNNNNDKLTKRPFKTRTKCSVFIENLLSELKTKKVTVTDIRTEWFIQPALELTFFFIIISPDFLYGSVFLSKGAKSLSKFLLPSYACVIRSDPISFGSESCKRYKMKGKTEFHRQFFFS